MLSSHHLLYLSQKSILRALIASLDNFNFVITIKIICFTKGDLVKVLYLKCGKFPYSALFSQSLETTREKSTRILNVKKIFTYKLYAMFKLTLVNKLIIFLHESLLRISQYEIKSIFATNLFFFHVIQVMDDFDGLTASTYSPFTLFVCI